MISFHELIHLLGVTHEDVLMKLFMYSLDGSVHEWFRSLPTSTISSLKELHESFHYYCEGIYSSELLLHNYYEEFEIYTNSSGSIEKEAYEEYEKNVDSDQIPEDAILSSLHVTQNEGYVEHNVPPFEIDEGMFFPFDSCDSPTFFNTPNEFLVQEDNQEFQECFTALNACETHGFYEIL